jgi:two-component system response regulator AtoC
VLIPVFRTLEKVLDSDTTVLIEGESGTGKDALAHWLHSTSSRKHAPFIKIDLGSLPEELVESELFGYERGAFTGAQETKLGKFDLAQGGTIVLDEIANVDLHIQAKLLHVVEAKQFFRLGGSRPITLDSRIVALSGTPLATAVERQTFRQDLFFRLNLIQVRVPSLRERRNEVLEIATRLLAQLDRKYGTSTAIAAECHPILLNYDFPGNVRELRNGLERALLMSSEGRIVPGVLPPNWLAARASGKLPSLEDIEREYIAQVLIQTRGKKTKAAEVLGISRKTLLEKRKKYGLE